MITISIFLAGVGLYFYWATMKGYKAIPWRQKNKPLTHARPLVSVIIAARNEEDHIEALIDHLKAQTYPNREIIIVNDHSTDATVDKLREAPDDWKIILNEGHGKKQALQTGLEHAQGEFLLFTDADCIHVPTWIHSMISGHLEANASMTTGPVISIPPDSRWVTKYFYQELLAWLTITYSAIRVNLHPMANGANMMLSRRAMPKGDIFSEEKSPSGDDVFLAEYFFNQSKLYFNNDRRALVKTYPPENWRALIQQRRRWSSKNKMINNDIFQRAIRHIGFFYFLLGVQFIFVLLDPRILPIFIFTLFIKSLLDHRLIRASASECGIETSWWQNFLLQPFTLWVSWNSQIRKWKWKGRSYH